MTSVKRKLSDIENNSNDRSTKDTDHVCEFESMNEENLELFRDVNSVVLPINHPKRFYQLLSKNDDKDNCFLGKNTIYKAIQ
jgi:hypothetical protein